MPKGKSAFFRVDREERLSAALETLESKGVVRNASATELYAKLKRLGSVVEAGTYSVAPGMSASALLASLRKPIVESVYLPGWWISRIAAKLEKRQICSAADYIALASKPDAFKGQVSFVLPKDSLEGYLYPATYNLEPMCGAKTVILKQLQAFQRNVASRLPPKTDLHRALTIGSLIQAEVKNDSERPLVARVIENRLEHKIPLEFDTSVLYALGTWRVLKPNEVHTIASPYNTYLHDGLPPGPICSPAWPSVEAALKPASATYLYFVAKSDGSLLFATSYQDHLRNIRIIRKPA